MMDVEVIKDIDEPVNTAKQPSHLINLRWLWFSYDIGYFFKQANCVMQYSYLCHLK